MQLVPQAIRIPSPSITRSRGDHGQRGLQQVSCLTFCSDAGTDGMGSKSYDILVEQQGLILPGLLHAFTHWCHTRCTVCMKLHPVSLQVQADAVNVVCRVFWSPQQPKQLKFVAPTGSEGPVCL
jgi:hypothetical protein